MSISAPSCYNSLLIIRLIQLVLLVAMNFLVAIMPFLLVHSSIKMELGNLALLINLVCFPTVFGRGDGIASRSVCVFVWVHISKTLPWICYIFICISRWHADRVSRNVFLLFFNNKIYRIKNDCTEDSLQKRRKVFCGVIKCKPFKRGGGGGGGGMKRQLDGRSENLLLNFKHLDQGCICDKIQFVYY